MIIVTAKNILKEGNSEKFKELAKDLISETRKENGCISYNLNQDIKNQDILTFIEEWESEEALQLHMNTLHFTSIVPKLSELQEENSILNIYNRV